MSINVDGTDYGLIVGDYDLNVVFSKKQVDGGLIEEDVFEKNVVAYHTTDAFRNFVNDVFDEGGGLCGQLLLVSLGGPGAIEKVISKARTHGVKGSRAGTVRKTRAWQGLFIEALVTVGHSAMKEYYSTNKEDMWKACSIPADAQSDDFVQMLINTGRGTIGYKVDTWTGMSPKTGDEGAYAINLNFRLDANNKGRAKRKENGVSEAQPAAASAAPAK